MTHTETDSTIVWSMNVPDEAKTHALAVALSTLLRADDFVSLSGDLGAGKTTFARALIRHLMQDPDLEVPSPTFTLLQVYESEGLVPIVHADLYRLRSDDELTELGWDDAAGGALVLAEWPDRIHNRLPADRLDIAFRLVPDAGAESRFVTLTATGTFASRLRQAKAIRALLDNAGYGEARRTFMTGDASTRAYERLTRPDGKAAVLMISPPRTDAPTAPGGRPYFEVARLAPDIKPFLAMDRVLKQQGVSVPKIYAADSTVGLAVIEDFGAEPVVQDGAPIPERYAAAVELLARLHDHALPEIVPGEDGTPYVIPPYDLDAYLVEVELVIAWYAPHIAGVTLPATARTQFLSIWSRIFEEVMKGPTTWCLRDFHSPNLIWMPDRKGIERVGVLDFQDCVIGHPAYDVASLLQDARVTVTESLELRLLGAYAQHRRAINVLFDMASFAENYAILGVQRATKVLGGFARLDKRDRKPQYLVHIPRIESYLAKGLQHPALAELRGWYKAFLPKVFGAVELR